MTSRSVVIALNKLKSLEKAKVFAHYFKTEVGQYAHGDVFIGISVPDQRKVAKRYKDIGLLDIQKLLESKIHEHRLTALLILTYKPINKEIYDFYLRNIKRVNNWDLVDVSAPEIVGKYLFDKNKNFLEIMTHSENIWERRIAIVSTYYFIKHDDIATTLSVATRLLHDDHDLIHKAVGWMLREVGKKDREALEHFLYTNGKDMPRTMFRYATEHFSFDEREAIME